MQGKQTREKAQLFAANERNKMTHSFSYWALMWQGKQLIFFRGGWNIIVPCPNFVFLGRLPYPSILQNKRKETVSLKHPDRETLLILFRISKSDLYYFRPEGVLRSRVSYRSRSPWSSSGYPRNLAGRSWFWVPAIATFSHILGFFTCFRSCQRIA